MASDVNNARILAPSTFECCKDKPGARVCICVLCGSLFHISCAERKKFLGLGGIFGICQCDPDLTLKLNTCYLSTSNRDKYVIKDLIALIIGKDTELKKATERKEYYREAYNDLVKDKSVDDDNNGEMREEVKTLKRENLQLREEIKRMKVVGEADLCKEGSAGIEALQDKIDLLMQLNSEMKSKNKILEDYVFVLKNNRTFTQALGSANLNGEKKNVLVDKPQEKVPEIVVQCTERRGVSAVMRKIKDALSETKANINFFKKISEDKVIIKCERKSSVERVAERLATVPKTRIEVKKLKNPLIKIVGIEATEEVDKTEMEEDLKGKNNLSGGFLKVNHVYAPKSGSKTSAVLEVDRRNYAEIMNRGYVYLGWQRCKVYDEFNMNRCRRCCKYNHSSKKCNNTTSCPKCGGEHELHECDNDSVKCILCAEANRKYKLSLDTNHKANQIRACGTFKWMLKRNISETDYPFKPSLEWLNNSKGNNVS